MANTDSSNIDAPDVNVCQLCEAEHKLFPLTISDAPADFTGGDNDQIMICGTCRKYHKAEPLDPNNWRVLSRTMWSEDPAAKVMIFRLLSRLTKQSGQAWAQDALDMFYLEDDLRLWAEAGLPDDNIVPTRDSNGAILNAGDTVTLIKDLPVKGAGFTAKRGTSVRGISLTDNPEHIEGRVNGQKIILVAAFLKKSG